MFQVSRSSKKTIFVHVFTINIVSDLARLFVINRYHAKLGTLCNISLSYPPEQCRLSHIVIVSGTLTTSPSMSSVSMSLTHHRGMRAWQAENWTIGDGRHQHVNLPWHLWAVTCIAHHHLHPCRYISSTP